MTQNEIFLMQDLVRRKMCFHKNEKPHNIKLWGLTNWGSISKLVSKGILLTDYTRENRTVWYRPSSVLLQSILIPAIALCNFNKVESTSMEDYYKYIDKNIVLNQLPMETQWLETNIDSIEKQNDSIKVTLSGVLKDESSATVLAILTIKKNTFGCEFTSQIAQKDAVIDRMIKTMVTLVRNCIVF